MTSKFRKEIVDTLKYNKSIVPILNHYDKKYVIGLLYDAPDEVLDAIKLLISNNPFVLKQGDPKKVILKHLLKKSIYNGDTYLAIHILESGILNNKSDLQDTIDTLKEKYYGFGYGDPGYFIKELIQNIIDNDGRNKSTLLEQAKIHIKEKYNNNMNLSNRAKAKPWKTHVPVRDPRFVNWNNLNHKNSNFEKKHSSFLNSLYEGVIEDNNNNSLRRINQKTTRNNKASLNYLAKLQNSSRRLKEKEAASKRYTRKN